MHTVGVLPGWVCIGILNIEDAQADATYGLLDVGYPVQKLGTVDANQKYHDVAVCFA